MSPIINASVAMGGGIEMKAIGYTIANFSLQHFKAACHCRDHVRRIEAENQGQPFGPFFEDIMSYTSACIHASAATLEALINEIFIDPSSPIRAAYGDKFDQKFWGKPKKKGKLQRAKEAIASLLGQRPRNETQLRNGIERFPVLDKYNAALAKLTPRRSRSLKFESEDPIFKAAEALIELRNAFTHFKPNWTGLPHPLQDQLTGFFRFSPWVGSNDDFLAMQCMSASCASWAVETTREFLREFQRRTGVYEKKIMHVVNT